MILIFKFILRKKNSFWLEVRKNKIQLILLPTFEKNQHYLNEIFIFSKWYQTYVSSSNSPMKSISILIFVDHRFQPFLRWVFDAGLLCAFITSRWSAWTAKILKIILLTIIRWPRIFCNRNSRTWMLSWGLWLKRCKPISVSTPSLICLFRFADFFIQFFGFIILVLSRIVDNEFGQVISELFHSWKCILCWYSWSYSMLFRWFCISYSLSELDDFLFDLLFEIIQIETIWLWDKGILK